MDMIDGTMIIGKEAMHCRRDLEAMCDRPWSDAFLSAFSSFPPLSSSCLLFAFRFVRIMFPV